MIKNNPYELLEKEGIAKNLLSETGLKSLQLFDKAKKILEEFPKSKEVASQTEKMGELSIDRIKKEIEIIKASMIDEKEEAAKKDLKKSQSKKMIEKAEKVLDDLQLCRKRLREDRKRKIESGEIKAPKKKTLVAKLRQELIKTATLIPEKLKDDSDVIQRTQKAVLNFLNELKSIWGLNKIKPIQDELKEKFKKLEQEAA
jgi:hypothetical protein